MSSNALSARTFSVTSIQGIASAKPVRRARVKVAKPVSPPSRNQPLKNKDFNVFHERRSSRARRVSLAATPRPVKAKATAGDRVTMIARFACLLAIGSYLTLLSVELVSLYAG